MPAILTTQLFDPQISKGQLGGPNNSTYVMIWSERSDFYGHSVISVGIFLISIPLFVMLMAIGAPKSGLYSMFGRGITIDQEIEGEEFIDAPVKPVIENVGV
jgi:hypothetical protein